MRGWGAGILGLLVGCLLTFTTMNLLRAIDSGRSVRTLKVERLELHELAGDWLVTVRMRDTEDAEWREFQTASTWDVIDGDGGETLRERPTDTSKPWRETAYLRGRPSSTAYSFEHVFSGSLSMLQMAGTWSQPTRSVEWSGEWHRQRGDEVKKQRASGSLTLESPDRHVWRLDKYREDGTHFVDLEMIYERRPSP